MDESSGLQNNFKVRQAPGLSLKKIMSFFVLCVELINLVRLVNFVTSVKIVYFTKCINLVSLTNLVNFVNLIMLKIVNKFT